MISSSKMATLKSKKRRSSLSLIENGGRTASCLNPEDHRSDVKGGERRDSGTVSGVTMSGEDPAKK